METNLLTREPKKTKKKSKIKKVLLIILLFLIVIILGMAAFFAYRISQRDLFGWRLNFSINKVETNDYKGFAPTISFRYPKIFDLDVDKDKKYGKDYIIGMKLKTDDRTGCDVRLGGPELDLGQSADSLSDEIVGSIRQKATDFQLIEKKKITIGGQGAFKTSFSFLDPIGARVRLDQIFTKGKQGERFMIICGTGEYQYAFFQKDFNIFYDSITFDQNLISPKKWWQELFNFNK